MDVVHCALTHVGVSGVGGVGASTGPNVRRKHNEAQSRFFIYYGFAKASIGRAVETRLDRLWGGFQQGSQRALATD